jgi:hypothetical protein
MKIHRSHTSPAPNTTALPPALTQDQRLSLSARGVLAHILSFPDGTDITAESLAAKAKRNRGSRGESLADMQAVFAELEQCGYMVRRQTKDAQGQPVVQLEVYDTPGHEHG